MSDIRPSQLSDEEFLKYAYLIGYGKLSEEWVEELVKRLTASIDGQRSHGYAKPTKTK